MDKPGLTIFHLDGERGLRGGERQLLYLADQLRRGGHRNIIVCRDGQALEAEARRRGLETLPLPFLAEWDPLSAWRLRRRLNRENAPILHSHTSHGAALACLASEGTRVPRIAHRRVDFPVANNLACRLKYGRARKVIAVSEAIRRQLLAAGLSPERVVTIHDGLPRELIPSDRRDARGIQAARKAFAQDLPPNCAWIGNLAALVPHKDHSTLLKAMPAVLRQVPEALLLIGGSGPLRNALRAEAHELGIESRVRFLGQLPEPAALLRALDVFVLSSWGEGFGSVLLEAMAHGLPIAATRAGGVSEALAHGESALLAPSRDPRALAEILLRLLSEPDLARSLGEKALRRAREFSAEAMAEKTEGIYLEAAGSPP